MKKYLCLLPLVLVVISLPLTGQTLVLWGIDPYIFESHYLLHFCSNATYDVFVISNKGDTPYESKIGDYEPLRECISYEITLHQPDSIPTTLCPIIKFNIRGKTVDTYSIGPAVRCGSGNESIILYDYRQNTFMVPLYESPDIVGLHIKTVKARKE
jgi:hypothetical protein